MLADDGRLSLSEDTRDGKRKLDDYGSLYNLEHPASSSRSLQDTSGGSSELIHQLTLRYTIQLSGINAGNFIFIN